jgi:hypothetical protein
MFKYQFRYENIAISPRRIHSSARLEGEHDTSVRARTTAIMHIVFRIISFVIAALVVAIISLVAEQANAFFVSVRNGAHQCGVSLLRQSNKGETIGRETTTRTTK